MLEVFEFCLTQRWGLTIGPASREVLSAEGAEARGEWAEKYPPRDMMTILGRVFQKSCGFAEDFKRFRASAWACYWRNLKV